MAGNAIRVYDIQAVVTQKSAAVTDCRPTTAAQTAGTVTNPSHSADADLTTYAELDDAAQAQLTQSVFTNPSQVSDAGRDWATLYVTADHAGESGAETVVLEMRAAGTGNWSTVYSGPASGGEFDGTENSYDVTALVASYREALWELRWSFYRAGGTGTFRVYDARVELGGDVVGPTDAEVAEDVAELAAAKFANWYATLSAQVEAALTEFGGLDTERSTILNAIRDRTSAATAYTSLTASAARAEAEAWEDVATAAAIPRYTGPTL